jgi:hypothetical protein
MAKKKVAFKVESGIPLGKLKKASKYPFDKMKINDSFLVPSNGKKEINVRGSIANSVSIYNKSVNKKIKITIRKTEAGIRVWRIK